MNTDTELLRKLVELLEPCPGCLTGNGNFTGKYCNECEPVIVTAARDALPALSRLLEAGVPEGWKLVPEKITPEMVNAAYTNTGVREPGDISLRRHYVEYMWDAMLSAAPHPPSEGEQTNLVPPRQE